MWAMQTCVGLFEWLRWCVAAGYRVLVVWFCLPRVGLLPVCSQPPAGRARQRRGVGGSEREAKRRRSPERHCVWECVCSSMLHQ